MEKFADDWIQTEEAIAPPTEPQPLPTACVFELRFAPFSSNQIREHIQTVM